jgi:hypothetical protein
VHDRVEVIRVAIVGNFGTSHTAREVHGQRTIFLTPARKI